MFASSRNVLWTSFLLIKFHEKILNLRFGGKNGEFRTKSPDCLPRPTRRFCPLGPTGGFENPPFLMGSCRFGPKATIGGGGEMAWVAILFLFSSQ